MKPPVNQAGASTLLNFLRENPSVRYLSFQWVDVFGILRGRVLPLAYATSLAMKNGPISLGPVAHGFMADDALVMDTKVPSDRLGGKDLLYPDWSTLRRTNFGAAGDRHASVMCWITESSPMTGQLGYQRCPRSVLGSVLEQAATKFDLGFLVGHEVEFLVMGRTSAPRSKADGAPEPGARSENVQYFPACPDGAHYTAAAMRTPAFEYVEECVDALEGLGIAVQQFHPEDRGGQFEISLAPLPPLIAADNLVAAHETIKNVLARHGLYAVMYPKPLVDGAAAGAHAHLSLQRAAGAGEHDSDKASSVAEETQTSFLAGLLKRLPGLCAFSLPLHDSYARQSLVGGGCDVSWGTEDRSVPIRKVKHAHWELRCIDATANVYLTLAAYISAGLLGVRDREELIWRDKTQHGRTRDAPEPDTSDEQAKGTQLPQSLKEALAQLGELADGLSEIMGPEMVKGYLHIKSYEESAMSLPETEDEDKKKEAERRRTTMYMMAFS